MKNIDDKEQQKWLQNHWDDSKNEINGNKLRLYTYIKKEQMLKII